MPRLGPSEQRRDGLRRLRWRLRGAWQWPTFAAAVLAEGLLLHWLPVSGEDGLDVLGGLLLAGFLNLALVGGLAPAAGRLVRRRRPSWPQPVAADYAGTALVASGFVVLAVLGVLHRETVSRAQDDSRLALLTARRWIAHQAPREYVANLGRESVWKAGPHFYRACVPGPDPHKHLCVFVRTDGPNPTVSRDTDQRPNSVVAGPDNPGRQGA